MAERWVGRRTPEEEADLQRQEALRRTQPESAEQVIFTTELENSVITNMAEIGVYPFAVYSVIKMHKDSGAGDPSYTEIAQMTGINRSTVVRSVRKLTELNLLSSERRVKEDGSQASNQYSLRSPRESR